MKFLLSASLLLLTGCQLAGADADPAHQAITAYIKNRMSNPASYKPVRFSKAFPVNQQSLNNQQAIKILQQIDSIEKEANELVFAAQQRGLTTMSYRAEYNFRLKVQDSLRAIATQLTATQDTSNVAVSLLHAFRGKNQRGFIELDSVQFLIYKNGKVQPILVHKNGKARPPASDSYLLLNPR